MGLGPGNRDYLASSRQATQKVEISRAQMLSTFSAPSHGLLMTMGRGPGESLINIKPCMQELQEMVLEADLDGDGQVCRVIN